MFDDKAPLDPQAQTKANLFSKLIPILKPNDIQRLYLHWSAEDYGCGSDLYNAMIVLENGEWTPKIEHDFHTNAVSSFDPDNYAAHTWRRNTGALGLCVAGMDTPNVDANNLGADYIQIHELELMCAVAAVICKKYGLDSEGSFAGSAQHTDNNGNLVNTHNEFNIATHAEVAVWDSYPTERWDLGVIEALPNGENLTPTIRTQSGSRLRGRINAYKSAL